MTSGLAWSRGTRRVTLLFAGLLLISAMTLVGLGLALLKQDSELSAQRAEERRQAAADRVARALEGSLGAAEGLLGGGTIPEGAVRITVSAAGIRADPPGRALWVPAPAGSTEVDPRPFAEAERLEFQGFAEKASRLYEEMAASPGEGLRAGALLRLARVHRRADRIPAALDAYRRLIDIDGITIDGTPADLVARRESCRLLAAAGRREEVQQEAATLRDDLASGRWTLDHVSWLLAAEDVARWDAGPLAPTPDQRAFSAAAAFLWQEWQRVGLARFPASGHRVVSAGDIGVTVLWGSSPDRVDALAIAPSLVRRWAEQASAPAREIGAELTLAADAGLMLFGTSTPPGQGAVRRRPDETRLPWTLTLVPGNTATETEEFRARRRLLSSGLVAIVIFLAAGISLLWRLVQRELAVARLQTDFVSAVSHEFRTPLTSLGHFTELLQDKDEPSPGERQAFYAALARNTRRLRRLVESLLDFARMEVGRRPYDLRAVEADDFARQVVEEFQKEVEPRGFTVNLDVAAPAGHRIQADAGALAHALWNLLDNAVKYSAEARTVWVSVDGHPDGTAIAVRDEGLGIPRREQKRIFRKFVRGEHPPSLGIQGTGIGLAMVKHIVDAHGGRITVDSEPGRGSTFTIVLRADMSQGSGIRDQGSGSAAR